MGGPNLDGKEIRSDYKRAMNQDMKKSLTAPLVLAFVITCGAFLRPARLSAGAVSGPRVASATAAPLGTQRFEPILFRGGELARIAISGDGSTILDLYVYDADSNLIDFDENGYVDCIVRFRPRWDAYYYVKVVNRGVLSNTFGLATN
jgi:hypothetical protein